MIERLQIGAARTVDGGADGVHEARVRWKTEFPGRSARRMTHLGLLLDLCLREVERSCDTPLVYASAYAESCSLEDFIDSFPHPSPMGFQTSIHPSGVEQSMILRKQPVERFYPITSGRNLAGIALENAFLVGSSQVTLAGGEEKGTWLTPFGLASERSFAFAIDLRESVEDAIGEIVFEKVDLPDDVEAVELPALYRAIVERSSLRLPSHALGGWLHLAWR